MNDDSETRRDRNRARASIQSLLRTRAAYLDNDGFKVRRNVIVQPGQLDVDGVVEQLQILGVSPQAITVAVKQRPAAETTHKATEEMTGDEGYFEVRVSMPAVVDVLAPVYPEIRHTMTLLIPQGQGDRSRETDSVASQTEPEAGREAGR